MCQGCRSAMSASPGLLEAFIVPEWKLTLPQPLGPRILDLSYWGGGGGGGGGVVR